MANIGRKGAVAMAGCSLLLINITMTEPTTTSLNVNKIVTVLVFGVTMVSAIVGSVLAIDTRYAKVNQVTVDLNSAKNEIIITLSHEVSKNRAVMVAGMQRNADDIEFEMRKMELAGQPESRYLKSKLLSLMRDIESLKHEK